MTENAQNKSSVKLLVALMVLVVIGAAVMIVVQNNKSNAQIATLTAQAQRAQEDNAAATARLQADEQKISELQPEASKARTLPIRWRINTHEIAPGYGLYVQNEARESMRFVVNLGGKNWHPVIDAGHFWKLGGLASGDVVTVDSEGYDTRTITIP